MEGCIILTVLLASVAMGCKRYPFIIPPLQDDASNLLTRQVKEEGVSGIFTVCHHQVVDHSLGCACSQRHQMPQTPDFGQLSEVCAYWTSDKDCSSFRRNGNVDLNGVRSMATRVLNTCFHDISRAVSMHEEVDKYEITGLEDLSSTDLEPLLERQVLMSHMSMRMNCCEPLKVCITIDGSCTKCGFIVQCEPGCDLKLEPSPWM